MKLVEWIWLATLLQVNVHAGGQLLRRPRAVIPKNVRPWHNAIVPYDIQHFVNPKARQLLNAAMSHFEEKTCVRFVEKDEDEHDYVEFVDNDEGCYFGTRRTSAREVMVVNLSKECYRLDAILHELGHVLGLEHEHQRPDRDEHIAINAANVNANLQSSLNKFLANQVIVASPYDFHSIMHYNALKNGKGESTILSRLGLEHSQRTSLSNYDIRAINQLYMC